MGPITSHSPVSWLKLHRAVLLPGGSPSTFGKRAGAGTSKFSPPWVWIVNTIENDRPAGSGAGSRSGATGAIPTFFGSPLPSTE